MEVRKLIVFFLFAFLLFAVDLACTYTTFAVLGVPIEFEVNQVFRDWVIQHGWLVSIGRFTALKAALFAIAAWMIFKTRNRVCTFILAQCFVSNHLVAISSHPTLWWVPDLAFRSVLLRAIAVASLLVTFYGIRYLRSQAREADSIQPVEIVCENS
jgi:hypothetical protein